MRNPGFDDMDIAQAWDLAAQDMFTESVVDMSNAHHDGDRPAVENQESEMIVDPESGEVIWMPGLPWTRDVNERVGYITIDLPEVVDDHLRCPGCGETRQDFLVWDKEYGEKLECTLCETVYVPGTTLHPKPLNVLMNEQA